MVAALVSGGEIRGVKVSWVKGEDPHRCFGLNKVNHYQLRYFSDAACRKPQSSVVRKEQTGAAILIDRALARAVRQEYYRKRQRINHVIVSHQEGSLHSSLLSGCYYLPSPLH